MSKAYNPKTGQYEVEREQFDAMTEKLVKEQNSFSARAAKIGAEPERHSVEQVNTLADEYSREGGHGLIVQMLRAYAKMLTAQQAETGADERELPGVHGVGRIADNPCAVLVLLKAEPSDDALREIHDRLRAAQSGQRAGVAEGWKLVPVELTDEMRQAAYDAFIAQSKKRNGLVEAYRAALAAAPTQQQEGV